MPRPWRTGCAFCDRFVVKRVIGEHRYLLLGEALDGLKQIDFIGRTEG
jgi:hypothetical protein